MAQTKKETENMGNTKFVWMAKYFTRRSNQIKTKQNKCEYGQQGFSR